jgi:uncharacterized protein (DUF1697 family)
VGVCETLLGALVTVPDPAHAADSTETAATDAARRMRCVIMPDSIPGRRERITKEVRRGTYIALIRGINVSNTQLSMERLRRLFATCGFDGIRTYIQSGNVVFDSDESQSACVAAIEGRLRRELAKPVGVVVRTPGDLASVVAHNPFLKDKGVDAARLSVAFLAGRPKAEGLKALGARDWGRDRYHHRGEELYLYCPDGFGRSKLAATFERLLGVGATVRNWNTVTKLLEMATI